MSSAQRMKQSLATAARRNGPQLLWMTSGTYCCSPPASYSAKKKQEHRLETIAQQCPTCIMGLALALPHLPIEIILIDPKFKDDPRPAVIANDSRFEEVRRGEYCWGQFRMLSCGFSDDSWTGEGPDPCPGCNVEEIGKSIANNGGILIYGGGYGTVKHYWEKGNDQLVVDGGFVKSVLGVYVNHVEFQLESTVIACFPGSASENRTRLNSVGSRVLPFVFETEEKLVLKLAPWALLPTAEVCNVGTLTFHNIHLLNERDDLKEVRDRVGYYAGLYGTRGTSHANFMFIEKYPTFCEKYKFKISDSGGEGEVKYGYSVSEIQYDLKGEISPYVQEEYAKRVASYMEKMDACQRGGIVGERVFAARGVAYYF